MQAEQIIDQAVRAGARIEPAGDGVHLRVHGRLTRDTEALLRTYRPRIRELFERDPIIRACAGLPLAPSDFRRRLSLEDLEEVEAGRVSAGALRAWAELVATNLQVERGRVPAHWTAVTTCRGCGPVPIWPGAPQSVDGCPWCAVRAAGRPIPGPTD